MVAVRPLAIPWGLGSVRRPIRRWVPDLCPLYLLFLLRAPLWQKTSHCVFKFICSSEFYLVNMLKLPTIHHNLIVAKCNKWKWNYSGASLLSPCRQYTSVYFAAEKSPLLQEIRGTLAVSSWTVIRSHVQFLVVKCLSTSREIQAPSKNTDSGNILEQMEHRWSSIVGNAF